jgi:hypothetical protein
MRKFSAALPAHFAFMNLAAGAALAVALALGATSGAEAKTGPTIAPQIDHYAMCLGLLTSDPVKHAKDCMPSNNAPGGSSLTSFSGGTVTASAGSPSETTSSDDSPCSPPPCGEEKSWHQSSED